MIKTQPKTDHTKGVEKPASPAQIIEEIERECGKCTILTPITCATKCRLWKIKREFRRLHEIMKTSNYMINLLNTLKNKRRLQILEMLSKRELSLPSVQQELKKHGYHHSQETIAREYLAPLIDVGLVGRENNRYYATIFGFKINELIKDFHEIAEIFPTHSECYEEIAISILIEKSRTYEELKRFIPAKSVARVLQRLQKSGLIYAPKERDYIFYFKTRRDPSKLEFSLTERRVYENIPAEGIPTRKLAEKTGISLRRTYKYIRRLRRKKLVFARKQPKTYTLTEKGFKTAIMLNEIRKLVADFLAATAMLTKDSETLEKLMPDTKRRKTKRKEREIFPLTVLAPYRLTSK